MASLSSNPNSPSTTTTSPPSAHPTTTLTRLSFNQNSACFSAGTTHGFRIYNCDPYIESFRRDFDHNGFSIVQMLFNTNMIALVGSSSGGPHHPHYPINKVMLWDDHQCRCIGELSFRSEVRGVRLHHNRIVVVLVHKVYVYDFSNLKLLYQIETVSNCEGLCEISQCGGGGGGKLVLVCPGLHKGQVRIEHFDSRKTRFLMAHSSRIACLGLSFDGGLVATASSKGTLVRVFNSVDGTLLQEVRRGADRADIYSLAFSTSAQWLAVSSDKGTVHVFSLKVFSGSLADENLHVSSKINAPAVSVFGSSLSFIKGVLPRYFNSEWSVAQFHLVEGVRYVVAFGHQKNTLVILGMNGSFYRCQFDPVKGGEMIQLEHYNFMKSEEPF